MRISIIGLILCLCSAPAFSATFTDDTHSLTSHPVLLLAGASQDEKSEPESGSLIIPGEDQDKKDKQCLNVCKKWGEECVIISGGGASVNTQKGSVSTPISQRKCRKTCKEFGEECF
jgi:hypothetical protein